MNEIKDITQPVKRNARTVEVSPSGRPDAPAALTISTNYGDSVRTVLTDDERRALIIALGGQA